MLIHTILKDNRQRSHNYCENITLVKNHLNYSSSFPSNMTFLLSLILLSVLLDNTLWDRCQFNRKMRRVNVIVNYLNWNFHFFSGLVNLLTAKAMGAEKVCITGKFQEKEIMIELIFQNLVVTRKKTFKRT